MVTKRSAPAAGAAPVSRSINSGTKRATAKRNTTAMAIAASPPARPLATGTSRSRGCPGASSRATRAQAKRSTMMKSVAAITSSCTPPGQENAAEVPMAARANSSKPQRRRKNRRRPGRKAWRGALMGAACAARIEA